MTRNEAYQKLSQIAGEMVSVDVVLAAKLNEICKAYLFEAQGGGFAAAKRLHDSQQAESAYQSALRQHDARCALNEKMGLPVERQNHQGNKLVLNSMTPAQAREFCRQRGI